jgi:hypothetical protein
MRNSEPFIITLSLICMALGLVFSFWPLVPLGIALLVLYGHTALGIGAGLFFDAVFGAPVGPLAFLHFPFLLFAVLCVGLRVTSVRFILPRSDLGAL